MTPAICRRASGGNTARISESPAWCRRTPGIDQTFEKSRGQVGVDGEIVAVKPLDVAIPARDDRELLRVGLDPEPIRLGKRAELLGRRAAAPIAVAGLI